LYHELQEVGEFHVVVFFRFRQADLTLEGVSVDKEEPKGQFRVGKVTFVKVLQRHLNCRGDTLHHHLLVQGGDDFKLCLHSLQ